MNHAQMLGKLWATCSSSSGADPGPRGVMWIPKRSLEYFWLLTWNRLKRRQNFADPTFSPKPRFSLFAVRICSWISSTVMGWWSTNDWWWMVTMSHSKAMVSRRLAWKTMTWPLVIGNVRLQQIGPLWYTLKLQLRVGKTSSVSALILFIFGFPIHCAPRPDNEYQWKQNSKSINFDFWLFLTLVCFHCAWHQLTLVLIVFPLCFRWCVFNHCSSSLLKPTWTSDGGPLYVACQYLTHFQGRTSLPVWTATGAPHRGCGLRTHGGLGLDDPTRYDGVTTDMSAP